MAMSTVKLKMIGCVVLVLGVVIAGYVFRPGHRPQIQESKETEQLTKEQQSDLPPQSNPAQPRARPPAVPSRLRPPRPGKAEEVSRTVRKSYRSAALNPASWEKAAQSYQAPADSYREQTERPTTNHGILPANSSRLCRHKVNSAKLNTLETD